MAFKNAITDYWLNNYLSDAGMCTLCGQRGVIDTRDRATTSAGHVAGRLNYCICPNGQALRESGADLEKWRVN